jgi:nucleoside-diphosphate-sugar epimerase
MSQESLGNMNNQGPISIIGATGFIGRHLVERSQAEHVAVRILTRGTHPLPQHVILRSLMGMMRRPSSLTVNRVRALSTHTRFLSSTIQAELSWRPEIGYKTVLHHAVIWYRKTGRIK